MIIFRLVAFVALLVFQTAPALAQASSTTIPEPSDLALFATGLIGLIVGRQAAKRRDDPPSDR